MIPLKVCSRINRLIIGLTTWMKKYVVSVQISIKGVSMEVIVMGYLRGKECVGVAQRPSGFVMTLNMWDPLTSIQVLVVVFRMVL